MSTWFKDRRQEFIAATFKQFGQVRRSDLVREFEITLAVASADIAEFLAADPPNVKYDVSAKAYILLDAGDKAITARSLKMVERPFAYCCAEGGGRVEACDCVNKKHGTALFEERDHG